MSCANTYYDVPLVDRVEALEDVGGTGTGEAEEFPIARAARSIQFQYIFARQLQVNHL